MASSTTSSNNNNNFAIDDSNNNNNNSSYITNNNAYHTDMRSSSSSSVAAPASDSAILKNDVNNFRNSYDSIEQGNTNIITATASASDIGSSSVEDCLPYSTISNTSVHLHQPPSATHNFHNNNMPKSNEPVKVAYPVVNSSPQQHIQLQHQQQQPQRNIQTTYAMNPNNQAGNRTVYTSQTLPNGTINISTTSQAQLMHTVSAAQLPNATTIKTITAGQHQQQQHQQQQHHLQPQQQTLVIKNQAGVTLPAGLVSSSPGIVTMTKTIHHQGNQHNMMGTPTMLPANVVVGMRQPGQQQQKNAPVSRVLIGGPHMVGTRPNSPAITLSQLNQGNAGPALILKTESGYQLLRVNPTGGAPVGQTLATNAGNQTIRLQTVPASMAPTSANNIVVNSVSGTNTTQVYSSQANALHHQQTTIASVAPISAIQQQQQQQHHMNQQQQQQQQQVQQQHVQVQQQNAVVSTAQATVAQNTAAQGNTKEKCRKFLANLIELSTRESKPVERNVRTLIQELVDASVEPEEFCDRLERLLNASPQPCLIGFLKKSLPLLRQSLFTKELIIDGIKPPPQHVVLGNTTITQQLPRIQAQIRPIGPQTTTIGQTQVRMITPTGARPIGQTTITKQQPVRIQGPIPGSGQRMVNTQIRAVGPGQQGQTQYVQTNAVQSQQVPQQVNNKTIMQIRPATTQMNRMPGTVQIRTTAPAVKTQTIKNAATGVTHVKVGQTQIKSITPQNQPSLVIPQHQQPAPTANNSLLTHQTLPVVNSHQSATVTVPVNNSVLNNASHLPTTVTTNATTNKIVTIKAQAAQQAHKATNKKKQQQEEKAATAAAAAAASSFYQQPSISMSTSMYGDDDINDVAAMGGVNLAEESQRILGSTENIGTQIRSCKDEVFLSLPALQARLRAIAQERGMEEPSQDVAVLISHACQERLKNIVEQLAVIAEHRIDVIKLDPRYEVTKDVRAQLKFLEELDKAELKRHDEQEREMLLRAAKSRSKAEDPEQAKLKAKAKEMQRAEMEELRQRDANMTALQAIGPRKKPKLDNDATTTGAQSGSAGTGSSGISPAPLRPRIKRVNLRDMLFYMEQDKEYCRSELLYKSYLK